MRLCAITAATLLLSTGLHGADRLHGNPTEVFSGQRLFTTADERRVMDAERAEAAKAGSRGNGMPVVADSLTGAEAHDPVHLHGVAVRSDGAIVVWLDAPESVSHQLVGDDRVRVTLADGRTATLLPGQTWYPDRQWIGSRHAR